MILGHSIFAEAMFRIENILSLPNVMRIAPLTYFSYTKKPQVNNKWVFRGLRKSDFKPSIDFRSTDEICLRIFSCDLLEVIVNDWLYNVIEASGVKEESMSTWTMPGIQGYRVVQLSMKLPNLKVNSLRSSKKDVLYDFWVTIQNVLYALISHFTIFIMGTMEQVMTKTLVINSVVIYYQSGKWWPCDSHILCKNRSSINVKLFAMFTDCQMRQIAKFSK